MYVVDVYTSNTQKTREARLKMRRQFPIIFYPGDQAWIDFNKSFQYSVRGQDFEDFHQRSIEILDELRVYVQQHGWDLTGHMHDYTKRLSRVGLAMYNTLFPAQIRQYITETDAEEERRQRGLLLMLTQPPDFKPFWEMLYMGSPHEIPKPDMFWGTRYPLGRNLLETPPFLQIELGEGLLAAIHSDLDMSSQEIQHIAQLLARCSKKQLIWLDKVLPKKDQISPDHLMNLLIEKDFNYGVIHLACHCKNPHDAGATQAYLWVTVHDQDLKVPLIDFIIYEQDGFPNHPFFFLNACETQTPAHLMQSLSFPTNLLKLRAGGVIATSCIVPDNFASVFAREFYQRLFQRYRGENEEPRPQNRSEEQDQYIAEVLMETRRYFLEDCNNPLGLAYGLYARSDQIFRFY